jgi:hypothetical protein
MSVFRDANGGLNEFVHSRFSLEVRSRRRTRLIGRIRHNTASAGMGRVAAPPDPAYVAGTPIVALALRQ